MDLRSEETTKLQFRLQARDSQLALLRAQLRLWLLANSAGDEVDAAEVLAAATRAFVMALWRPGPVRTISIEVEARYANGVVELAVHDHAGPGGNTVRFSRSVTPARGLARAEIQPFG